MLFATYNLSLSPDFARELWVQPVSPAAVESRHRGSFDDLLQSVLTADVHAFDRRRSLGVVRRRFSLAAAVVAAVLGVICLLAVEWYVVDVLIGLRDAADRSMQFWGLALLGIGILAGLYAVGLAALAWRRWRR